MRIFTGKYINGVFVPKHNQEAYDIFKKHLEKNDLAITITITEPMKSSEKQLNLFNLILKQASEKSGFSINEIIDIIDDIRLRKGAGYGMIKNKPFEEYNTKEMTEMIKETIVLINDKFDLGLKLVSIDGITQIEFNK